MRGREFWIQVEPTHCGDSGKTRFCTDFVTKRVDDIHVREVLPGSITLTREELRAVIIERLKGNTQEMEGYSYYGSNPGVPEDEYGNIADEVIEKVFGEEFSDGK